MTSARRCSAAEREAALETLTEALAEDPLLRWALAGDGYERHLRNLIAADVDEALAGDELWTTLGMEAIAAWSPPITGHERFTQFEAIIAEEDPEPFGDRLEAVNELDRSLLRALEPARLHWFLESLGTRADARRSGHAGAVLAPVLERCDRDRIAAVVDSSNPDALPFYERHGFRIVTTAQTADSPTIWALMREPREP